MRSSSLDIGRHCPLAPRLADQYPGAGRSALLSSAFHANMAGAPDARERYDRLLPEEVADLNSWNKPLELELNADPIWRTPHTPPSREAGRLTLQNSEREIPLGISAEGRIVPHGDRDALIEGHPDMMWLHGGVAYVGDIKRSRWTVDNPPETLQLLSYGFMAAEYFDATAFCVGIWAAIEGEWIWGPIRETFLDDETDQLWQTILATAQNPSTEPVQGIHCRNCYQRQHCPQWQVRLAHADDLVKKTATVDLTDEDAVRLYIMRKQLKEYQEFIEEQMKSYVNTRRPTGFLDSETGSVYRPRPRRGKEYASVSELRRELGEDAEKYIHRAKTSLFWDWGRK
jgi:hypothetical protein